ncbi:7073_t:CDS:1, partial [Entrophospora sp. SA101]
MKFVRYLPPSPNWYSGCASLCVESNIFAYASYESIILLDSDTFEYVGTLKGHKDK